MYSTRSNLILGFHGCELSEQKKLINDPSYVRLSKNSYDWLGHGMYFWENNPERALLWAEQKKKAGTLKEPAIVGAVLSLGKCLDLLDSAFIDLLKNHINSLRLTQKNLIKRFLKTSITRLMREKKEF